MCQLLLFVETLLLFSQLRNPVAVNVSGVDSVVSFFFLPFPISCTSLSIVRHSWHSVSSERDCTSQCNPFGIKNVLIDCVLGVGVFVVDISDGKSRDIGFRNIRIVHIRIEGGCCSELHPSEEDGTRCRWMC